MGVTIDRWVREVRRHHGFDEGGVALSSSAMGAPTKPGAPPSQKRQDRLRNVSVLDMFHLWGGRAVEGTLLGVHLEEAFKEAAEHLLKLTS